MRSLQRNRLARAGIIPLIACILLMSSMTFSSSRVLAAQCNPGIPLDASGGSASCDVSVAAQISSGPFTLAADSSATVPGSPFTLAGSDILAAFHFTTYIKDHRGSTNGGRLLAASDGITNNVATLPLNLISAAPVTCDNGTCTPPTFYPAIPLIGTPATILTLGDAGHTIVVDGDYTLQFNGNFTIPKGTSNGTYIGAITLTLLNTF